MKRRDFLKIFAAAPIIAAVPVLAKTNIAEYTVIEGKNSIRVEHNQFNPSDLEGLKVWHIADEDRAKSTLIYNEKLSPKEKADILDYFGKDNVAMVDISGNGNHFYVGGTQENDRP